MNKQKDKPILVLAVYPNMRGFGFVCLDWPGTLVDTGVIWVQPICNGKILKQFIRYVNFYRPEIVILRECDEEAKHTKRVTALLGNMADASKDMKLEVFQYSREQIKTVFEQFGARTKYEIALRLIEAYPQLKSKMPKLRKRWMPEEYSMPIFDALSLIVTHKYLTE